MRIGDLVIVAVDARPHYAIVTDVKGEDVILFVGNGLSWRVPTASVAPVKIDGSEAVNNFAEILRQSY